MVINKRIVHTNDEGGIAVLIPSPEWSGTLEQLAVKDVPTGKAYKIIDASEIPADRSQRNAWNYDFSSPDGYGG